MTRDETRMYRDEETRMPSRKQIPEAAKEFEEEADDSRLKLNNWMTQTFNSCYCLFLPDLSDREKEEYGPEA